MAFDDSGRDHHSDQEPGRAQHRFRYGPWRGGPDPLKPPFDVRAATTCSQPELYATRCTI